MSQAEAQSYFAYVGCYTTPQRQARGKGISVFRVSERGRQWSLVQTIAAGDNPSFLAVDRTGRYLCAVHGDRSHISSYAIDRAAGTLFPVSANGTSGTNPVHLAFDPTNRFIVLANHWTSTVALLPFDESTGEIGAVVDLVVLQGEPGPHRIEQHMAKPHQTVFDPSGRYVFVPDKGIDRIFSFCVQDGKLQPTKQGFVEAREAAGPRHIAFHPTRPFAYVANELDCTVVAYHFDATDGSLKAFQWVSCFPETYTGNGRASEIEVIADGTFLVVSTRGADLLTTFEIEQETGFLQKAHSAPCGGKTPRFFTFLPSEKVILVANEGSDNIVGFDVDLSNGDVINSQLCAETESPSVICVLPAEKGVQV